MGIKDVKIIVDNPLNVYYPGQTINGRVEYTLDAPKKVKGIIIKFKGEAETSWSKSQSYRVSGKIKHKNVHYSANEEYYNTSYNIVGGESGGEPIEIPIGKNVYPFVCHLPLDLPSSFEGKHGFVRYTIKVTLDRPWKFDQDTKMAFTVVSNFDLNFDPRYRNPIQFELTKSFGCCCCPSGDAIITVRLPVKGYCCGQAMPLDVTCENNSTTSLNDVRIILRKKVIFHAHHPHITSKESSLDVAEMSFGEVKSNMSLNWQQFLEVPPLPPSNLMNCKIIDVEYEVVVVCSPSGCHTDKESSSPVFIGTVPLVGFQSSAVQNDVPTQEQPLNYAPSYTYNPSLPAPGTAYPGTNVGVSQPGEASAPGYPHAEFDSSPPPYDVAVQPIFKESQFTAKSLYGADEDSNMRIAGKSNFAPHYPTYGFVIPEK